MSYFVEWNLFVTDQNGNLPPEEILEQISERTANIICIEDPSDDGRYYFSEEQREHERGFDEKMRIIASDYPEYVFCMERVGEDTNDIGVTIFYNGLRIDRGIKEIGGI